MVHNYPQQLIFPFVYTHTYMDTALWTLGPKWQKTFDQYDLRKLKVLHMNFSKKFDNFDKFYFSKQCHDNKRKIALFIHAIL